MQVNDLNRVIIHQKKNYLAQALENQVRNLQQQLQQEKYNSMCLLKKTKCNEDILFNQLQVISNQLQMAQQNSHFKDISNGFLMRQNNELQSKLNKVKTRITTSLEKAQVMSNNSYLQNVNERNK